MSDLVIVILSQENDFHAREADLLKRDLLEQAKAAGMDSPTVYLTHEEWPNVPGSWTITVLLKNGLLQKHDGHNKTNWFLFLEDRTRLDIGKFIQLLAEYDPSKESSASEDNIIIAVKTCSKFRLDRVPVIQQTWGPTAKHLIYYSDQDDPSLPTVQLPVPNTERGHCAKTRAILDDIFQKQGDQWKWLMIVDDDTLLSVSRLQSLLSCYNSSADIALGERYGFGLAENSGYNYITGGGGMVFSKSCVAKIVHSSKCTCPRPDYPDDMMLGICLQKLNIPVIHSSSFHQARPRDYPESYLRHVKPVSFHKHWMIDPVKTYEKWLSSYQPQKQPAHTEL